jgi:prophage regulatory protein
MPRTDLSVHLVSTDADSSSTVPTAGFLRQPQVLSLIPISKSTLWRRVRARTFPVPVKLSERITVWRAEEVLEWMECQRCTGQV